MRKSLNTLFSALAAIVLVYGSLFFATPSYAANGNGNSGSPPGQKNDQIHVHIKGGGDYISSVSVIYKGQSLTLAEKNPKLYSTVQPGNIVEPDISKIVVTTTDGTKQIYSPASDYAGVEGKGTINYWISVEEPEEDNDSPGNSNGDTDGDTEDDDDNSGDGDQDTNGDTEDDGDNSGDGDQDTGGDTDDDGDNSGNGGTVTDDQNDNNSGNSGQNGDSQSDDDTSKVSDDQGADNTSEDNVDQSSVDQQSNTTHTTVDGGELPQTSIPWYNLLFIGILAALSSGALLWGLRRKWGHESRS